MRSFNSAGREGETTCSASSSSGTRACSNGPRDVFRKSASSTRQICSLSEFDARCIGRRSGRTAHLGAIRGIDRYEPSPRNRFADEREYDPRSTLHGAGKNGQKQRSNFPTLGVTRVPSEESHGYKYLLSEKAEGSQSGDISKNLSKTSYEYEYFDSSWKKNRGKSCTPHSRVSKLCRLRLLSDRITALRERGVWEPTKPGLRVLVCAASGDSKVLEDTSRRPERSRPPFRGRERERRHTRASIGGGTRFVAPRVSTNGTPARVFTAGRAIRGEA